MNYIAQLNTFFDIKLSNPLSANAQCLYINLFYMNNKCNWIERFTVSNTMLCALTGIDRRTLDRVRNELIQKGYIEYKKGSGNQAGTYLLVQFDTQNDIQHDIQNGTQMSHKMSTLYKHKQNNNISSSNDDGAYSKEKSLLANFEMIWAEYPRKEGKSDAYKHYKALIAGKKILGKTMKFTNDEIIDAVISYAEDKRDTDKKYIAQGSTFFNGKIIDYLLKGREKSE